MGLAAIEVAGVTIAFGRNILFTDLSLRVAPNEIFGVVGPSGAGKTSVGKLLCGLLAPAAGSVQLGGRPLAVLSPIELPVMCWQEASLFEHLDVAGNIALGLTIRRHPEAAHAAVVTRLLNGLGLAPLRNKRPKHLSGGERARVGLARALAVDPDVLILDEPFASLDVISRDRAIGLVSEFAQRPNKAAILISHVFADVAALCREVIVMDNATPRPQVTVSELVEQPRSAFEAQVSGRWRFAGATILRRESTFFLVATAFGEIMVEAAPWIAAERLAAGTTATLIAALRPDGEQGHGLAAASVRWLIAE